MVKSLKHSRLVIFRKESSFKSEKYKKQIITVIDIHFNVFDPHIDLMRSITISISQSEIKEEDRS